MPAPSPERVEGPEIVGSVGKGDPPFKARAALAGPELGAAAAPTGPSIEVRQSAPAVASASGTMAVVEHSQDHGLAVDLHRDADMAGLSVADHVDEGFAGDGEQFVPELGAEERVERPVDADRRFEPGGLGDLVDEGEQRRAEVGAIRGSRFETED